MVAIEMAKIRGVVTHVEGREEHSLKFLIHDWALLRERTMRFLHLVLCPGYVPVPPQFTVSGNLNLYSAVI